MKHLFIVICAALTLTACGNRERLVVYTAQPAELTDPIVERFEEEFDIKLDLIVAGTGEFVKRIEAERNAPLGDLLWAGTPAVVEPIVHLLENYTTPNEQHFYEAAKNREGMVTRFSLLPNVFIINKAKAGDLEINGYADLLKPELRGKIAMADPQKSSVAFDHVVNMLYAMGGPESDEAWSYVERFVANLDGKLLGGSSAVIKAVADGEFVVGLTYEEGGLRYSSDQGSTRIVYMTEGAAASYEGLYIIKGTQHLENAKMFVDFVTSLEIQSLMEAELNRRGVRNDITDSRLPEMNLINIIQTDEALVNANKNIWMNRFKDIFTQ